MAQDAELKLKVSLDLAYFRQRLAELGTELGGQSLQLNVQFNKKSIGDQYRLLNRYLEAKTFKVKVESNTLDTLVDKVSTFKKNLEKLGGETIKLGVNVESEVTKTKAAEVRRNIISDITGPKGVVFIPIEVKPPLVKNIKAIRDNIKDRLSGISIDVNVNANIPKGASGGSRPASLPGTQGRQAIDEIEKVLAQGASGALFGGSIERAQQNIAKQAILKRLEKESLGKGGYNKPGLEKIIRDLGGTPSGKREDLVAQAKKLVQESDGIADAVFDHLKDLQMKLRPIRGQAQTSAARSMPNLNQMLDRIANLTENPRAAQRMLRMMPESRLTTDLVGAANRQAAFREQYGPQGFRLPGFGGAKAFDPLLKSIAESFSDYTRTVNTSNPWMGKIGSGITTLISRALTQSPEQMFGGRTPVASAKLLPAAGQTSGTRLMREQLERANLPLLQAPSVGQENAPLSRAATYMLNRARRALELPIGPYSPYEPNPFAGRATVPSRQYFTPTMQAALPPVGATGGRLSLLEQQLAQSRGALGTGGGVAGSLFTGRALINPGVSMLSPVGISGNYRQMAAALANQAANPALAHRQIADIGFGGVPTAATGMSGEALNRALNQAFLQRRGLGIAGGQSLPIFNAPGVAVQQNIPGMAYRMGGGGLGGSMGMFPSAGMMGPSSPLTINARSSMFGGGGAMPPGGGGGGAGGMGGMGGFGRALGGVNLPGSGTIRELGEEFGFATKQVLLFGQAYKMLAFIQNFPAQVGAAVSQLQNFRNTLGAISPNAEEAASSNRLILDLVEKYNVPLQSARDGFTKLYASMAPAGFSGDEIRNLFTGITQAAATFGMSADKVDRVNYAFAQMASKGQVMSEELKGQLGDVLPGAMAIFAKAAGFEGSKAIQDFSAELEAGRYKGEAMVALLKNVGIVMRQEFGSGAEGAALTFQGIINRMQNSMTLLYESFEPVAVGFLNTVVVPLTDGIRQISDGFNAFFTGAATKTSGGFGIAQELERLKPTFEGLGQNVKALIEQFGQFARAGLEVGKVLLQIAGNPFVGYLARVYAAVLPLTLAIQALNLRALVPLIASFVRAIPVFVTYTAATAQGVTANKALQLAMVTTGKTAGVTATQIRTVGTAMKAAFTGTVIGAVLLGIGMLIEKIISLNASMADTKAKAMGAAQAIRSMSQTEAQQATRQYEAGAQSLKGLNEEIEQGKLKGKAWIEVTSQQAKALQDAGVIVSNVRGSLQVQPTRVTGAFQKLQGLAAEGKYRQELLSYEEKQAQQTVSLPPIPAGGGEEKGNEKALAKAAEEARRLADDKRKYEADLMNISFDQAINLSDMEFEHWKNLQQAKYDFLEAGQNEWMSRELKFQRDLQAIEIRRIETIRKAQVDTAKAEMKAATSAYVAGDSGAGGGAAMFGATGRVFNAPGWVHGHFQNMNREALVQDTVEVVMKLLQQGVKPELGSGQKFTAGMQQAQVEQLVRRGIASHKSYASGVGAIDVFVPQGTQVPVGLSGVSNLGGAAGISGNLPRGTQLMHLDPSSRSGAAGAAPAGVPASRIRAEAKKDYASALASQEAINAKEKENLATKYANIQAQQELNILIREYTASIVPIEQQKLENTLLQNRISLISSGAFGDALETEQKINEAREKAALGVQMANAQIEQNNKLVKDGIIKQEEADKLNASQVEKIKQLTEGLEAYIPLLRERLKLEQSSAEATLRSEVTRATPLGGMGLSAGFIGPAGDRFEEAIGRGATQDEASRFAELQNQLTLLESRNEAIKQSIYGIGAAFGEAMTTGVASLVSGTATAKEVFASFLQSVGQALSQAAAQMIATYIAIGIAKMFAGLSAGTTSSTGPNPGGIPSTGNVTAPSVNGFDTGSIANVAANGAVWKGGFTPFQAFANGGVVNGPTLGLIGEGKYNEAIVPLPDGRSIPVSFGGRSARDLMGNGAPGMPQAPSLSMKFETTKINGVEYVSREQLEQAMAETRRASIAGGAKQGMSMTLDKIKQSPSTRSSIGIR